ncbi:MAG: hypothetical protein KF773_21385 [Deltaproteobacteria bacterium]|nr:hypothetical protein [Deltaproteobacteria bacterium]MCW5806859.1 hypothetical protein [Deltaproteobacteria bacterium]
MTRNLAICIALVVVASCNKPSEDSCRAALANMRTLMGTESSNTGAELEAALRRCKGNSSKEAVECATKAKTIEELDACQFMHIPDKEAACKAALEKVKSLGRPEAPADAQRCRNYSRTVIKCAGEAANLEDVEKCGFLKKDAGSGS